MVVTIDKQYGHEMKKISKQRDNKLMVSLFFSQPSLYIDGWQGCYRYFPKVSPIFDIDTGCKSIVDTNIDTLP